MCAARKSRLRVRMKGLTYKFLPPTAGFVPPKIQFLPLPRHRRRAASRPAAPQGFQKLFEQPPPKRSGRDRAEPIHAASRIDEVGRIKQPRSGLVSV
ncbi:unnamed protein product [Urochloa humidicola]